MIMGIHAAQPNIRIGSRPLEVVKAFKYLGSTITEDRCSISETKIRIVTATAAPARLNPLLRNKSISIGSKIRLVRAVATATVLS